MQLGLLITDPSSLSSMPPETIHEKLALFSHNSHTYATTVSSKPTSNKQSPPTNPQSKPANQINCLVSPGPHPKGSGLPESAKSNSSQITQCVLQRVNLVFNYERGKESLKLKSTHVTYNLEIIRILLENS